MADVERFWKRKIPPPTWFALAIAEGVILDLVGVGFEVPTPTPVRVIVPVIALAAAGALAPRALQLFLRTGQDPTPWTRAPQLITSGPYRVSRNPMYVGLALVQIAVGVALANGWILVLVPASLVAVYATAIRPEEAYLKAEFGQAYLDYKASVRRWL